MQIENCVNRTLNVIFDITKTIANMNGIDSLVPDSKFIPNLDENTVYVQPVMEPTIIHTEECSVI